MAVSKAQQRATAKYVSKSYDRIEAKVPKGQKEVIQAHAEATDGTLNKFLNRAIQETMERDNSALTVFEGRTEVITGEDGV